MELIASRELECINIAVLIEARETHTRISWIQYKHRQIHGDIARWEDCRNKEGTEFSDRQDD